MKICKSTLKNSHAHFPLWKSLARKEFEINDACLHLYIAVTSLNYVCVEENGMHVIGIVFDTSSRTLFWSDVLKEIIAKIHVPLNGELGKPVILHNLTGSSPRGIALDVCNRCAIYNILRHRDYSSYR